MVTVINLKMVLTTLTLQFLGEDYIFKNKPLTVEWDPNTNEIKFLH